MIEYLSGIHVQIQFRRKYFRKIVSSNALKMHAARIKIKMRRKLQYSVYHAGQVEFTIKFRNFSAAAFVADIAIKTGGRSQVELVELPQIKLLNLFGVL